MLLSLPLRLFLLPHFSRGISLLRNHKTFAMQATLARPQIADVEKKTRRRPEGVRPKGFGKRLQSPVYFSFLKWRVEGHLLNKYGSYWRVNRPMLTQQHLPANALRIRFYAHLQRARLRCIAWTSPKKNKYYAAIKFFIKHYSNATNLTTIFSAKTINQLVVGSSLVYKYKFFFRRSVLRLWPLYLETSISTLISYARIIRWTQNH